MGVHIRRIALFVLQVGAVEVVDCGVMMVSIATGILAAIDVVGQHSVLCIMYAIFSVSFSRIV